MDDGSSDQAAAVVQEIQEKAAFPVRYVYKENGGKHTALNTGISLLCSELTIIADSDDTLRPNAVALIRHYHRRYRHRKDISGYSFLRVYNNGQTVVPMDQDELVATYIECRIARKIPRFS